MGMYCSMRLTLRNLLAYSHDMMAPEDRASFQALLTACPRAQALLARCQAVVQQRQLAALSLHQPSDRHSANTVSNYLDHQISDQQLGPFEKSALHSDEQLAEIVECHRVIADIVAHRVHSQSPEWKARLHSLAQKHNPHVPAPASEPVTVTTSTMATAPDSVTPTFSAHEYKLSNMIDIAKLERAVEETLLHDSDDLTDKLDEEEEELSESAARHRDRLRQKELNATLVRGRESRHTRKYSWPEQSSQDKVTAEDVAAMRAKMGYELTLPVPLLVGGVGGILLIGVVVWLCM